MQAWDTRTTRHRGTGLFATVLLSALALFAGVLATSAGATFLMVEDLGDPGSAVSTPAYDAAKYMGAKYERRIVNIDTWSNFDWAGKVDPYVNRAIAHGLKPYLAITAKPESEYDWQPDSARFPTPAQYATTCTQAATRYKGKVFDYAVWNEPNLTSVGNLDPAGYTWLYKECRKAIKAVDPSANVYFGELSTAASGWGGMNACEYFNSATPYNAGVVTEGVSIHPYQFKSSPSTKTSTECNGIGRLADWQGELAVAKSFGAVKTATGGQAPLVVSEFGYCGERPPLPPGDPLTPNAAKAACPQNASGLESVQSDGVRASWIEQAYNLAEANGVTIFDYHTVAERPAGDYLGNQGAYLWESGIVENPSGNWAPSVAALRKAVGLPFGVRFETPGVYRPSEGRWFMRYSNSSGPSDLAFFWGNTGDRPVAGDWNGDEIDTPGVYRPSEARWYMRNSNSGGPADLNFVWGLSGDLPVVGDWNGDGVDTIGIFRPSEGRWFMRNTNSAAPAELNFVWGVPGDLPVAGDWNGDGVDTIGIFRPSEGRWFMRNTNSAAPAELNFVWGVPGDLPVVGDWNGDEIDTIGVYRPSEGRWFMRNTNSAAPAELNFLWANTGDLPVVGDWNGIETD